MGRRSPFVLLLSCFVLVLVLVRTTAAEHVLGGDSSGLYAPCQYFPNNNITHPDMPLPGPGNGIKVNSSAECCVLCSVTHGCKGAVFDGESRCHLKNISASRMTPSLGGTVCSLPTPLSGSSSGSLPHSGSGSSFNNREVVIIRYTHCLYSQYCSRQEDTTCKVYAYHEGLCYATPNANVSFFFRTSSGTVVYSLFFGVDSCKEYLRTGAPLPIATTSLQEGVCTHTSAGYYVEAKSTVEVTDTGTLINRQVCPKQCGGHGCQEQTFYSGECNNVSGSVPGGTGSSGGPNPYTHREGEDSGEGEGALPVVNLDDGHHHRHQRRPLMTARARHLTTSGEFIEQLLQNHSHDSYMLTPTLAAVGNKFAAVVFDTERRSYGVVANKKATLSRGSSFPPEPLLSFPSTVSARGYSLFAECFPTFVMYSVYQGSSSCGEGYLYTSVAEPNNNCYPNANNEWINSVCVYPGY